MPSAFLFGLLGKQKAGKGNTVTHPLRLMAHHSDDAFGWRNGQRGANDVVQQRIARRFMQHLGLFRLHARSQPGSQNHDRYIALHFFELAFELCAARAALRT